MCRLLAVLNNVKDPAVAQAIQIHMYELEKALGGHGNGIYMPFKDDGEQLVKSYDPKETHLLNKIWDNMQSPFMFHTRLATGINKSEANCHPFEYNDKILMHNGYASGYLKPGSNADTLNLLYTWQDSPEQPTIDDMDGWSGIVITHEKKSNEMDIFAQKNFEMLTLRDGTVLVTSQTTPTIDAFTSMRQSLGSGVYKATFAEEPQIVKVKDYPLDQNFIPPQMLEDAILSKENAILKELNDLKTFFKNIDVSQKKSKFGWFRRKNQTLPK